MTAGFVAATSTKVVMATLEDEGEAGHDWKVKEAEGQMQLGGEGWLVPVGELTGEEREGRTVCVEESLRWKRSDPELELLQKVSNHD